jgi:hypothetical protein
LIRGNLQDASKEFLGNHQIPTPGKPYIQESLKDVSTEFLVNHQIPTPVKLYIQGKFQGL